ncbi:MAG TPA: transposase [Chthonomonadaceae bacterium]|nr:transposase [Chthonomonadaceae bacterium]
MLLITGWRWDPRRKVWTALELMTNLPLSQDPQHAGPSPFTEVAGLCRDRWDIEILFKLLKQHLSFDHLLSRTQNGIEVMIYRSLILTWLLLWYQRQTQIDRGWRSVKSWLAQDVQSWGEVALSQMTIRTLKPVTAGPNLDASGTFDKDTACCAPTSPADV